MNYYKLCYCFEGCGLVGFDLKKYRQKLDRFCYYVPDGGTLSIICIESIEQFSEPIELFVSKAT